MKKVRQIVIPILQPCFAFARKLEIRYEGNVRLSIRMSEPSPGYDPVDCSLEKGKNIRALKLKSIADHLNIDERLLIDIASGKVGLEEAVFEFKGYASTWLAT